MCGHRKTCMAASTAGIASDAAMINRTRVLLYASLAVNTLLLPIAINQHLRRTYEFTLAHWKSKIISTDRVFIGDSITAGGGDFGRFGTINLASNGRITEEIAAELPAARAYNPRRIFVMAGTNDIIRAIPRERTAAAWKTILSDRRVVVTLLPHTSWPSRNAQIDDLNAMIDRMARKAGRRVIAIPGLTQADGTIRARYTIDGTHLAPAAYEIWRAQIG